MKFNHRSEYLSSRHRTGAPSPALRALVDKSPNLDGLLSSWLQLGNGISFFPGLDDENKLDSLILEFKEKDNLVGAYSTSLADVFADYPEIESLSDPFTSKQGPVDDAVENWYENLEREHRAAWNEELFGIEFPRQALPSLILKHTLSLNGDLSLHFLDRRELGDLLDGDSQAFSRYDGRVVVVLYHYRDPQSQSDWDGAYYVVLK
jgi:hypothetical protein